MTHSKNSINIIGEITDVFSHRFVVETPNGKILADIGGHNKEKFLLNEGDTVEIIGEQKPSELKVHQLVLNGNAIALEDKQA